MLSYSVAHDAFLSVKCDESLLHRQTQEEVEVRGILLAVFVYL